MKIARESNSFAANNKKISREKPRGIIMLNRSIDRNVAVTTLTFRFAVAKLERDKGENPVPLFFLCVIPLGRKEGRG